MYMIIITRLDAEKHRYIQTFL